VNRMALSTAGALFVVGGALAGCGQGASLSAPQASPTTATGTTTTSTPPAKAAIPSPAVTAALCSGPQLRPSLGIVGSAAGAGHVHVVMTNISDRPCWLGGVLPLTGVSASGAATPLVFTPGSSDTAYPSPVVPGIFDPGDRGALWVTTCLNCETRSPLYSKLVIQVDARHSVEMAYPKSLTDGLPAAESAAGPIPPTK
jgi:hypothetical protein